MALSKASSTHNMPLWCGWLNIPRVGKRVGLDFLLISCIVYHPNDITEMLFLWHKITTTNK